MDENLVIGSELLDYMTALTDIAAELVNAQTVMAEIKNTLNDGETYEGEAKDSMAAFVESLSAHIERLQMFYQKAASYAYSTYESMYQSDAAMAAWILKQMDEGQVVIE